MRTQLLVGLVAGLFAVLSVPPASLHAEIKLGVNAARGAADASAAWGALGQYLETETGEKTTVVPLAVADFIAQVYAQKVSLVLANPVQMVQLQDKFGATPVASVNGLTGPHFAGSIIVKKSSGIKQVEDLKGKKVVSMTKAAAGAYVFQAYHLLQKGVMVPKDFASLEHGKKQDDLVLLVQAGVSDAAFVRAGLLESMAQSGRIKREDFVVLDEQTDANLPFARTTALYPEWYVASIGPIEDKTLQAVKTALLKVSPTSPVAQNAGIKGFIEPLQLTELRAAIQALKIYLDDQKAPSSVVGRPVAWVQGEE